MSSQDPPLNGWESIREKKCCCKLFHFSSPKTLQDFCFYLLQNKHDKTVLLQATECVKTQNVYVEIYSTKQKELKRLAHNVEERYHNLENDTRKTENAFWLNWFGKYFS